MSYEPYPAWRFTADGKSVVVMSPEEASMLDASWSDKIPEDWRSEGHPTYRSVELIEKPVDVEQIAEEVVKRKPGRPKKAE